MLMAALTAFGPIIGLAATGLGMVASWVQKKNQVKTLQQKLDDISNNYDKLEQKIRSANAAGDYAGADALLNQLRALHQS